MHPSIDIAHLSDEARQFMGRTRDTRRKRPARGAYKWLSALRLSASNATIIGRNIAFTIWSVHFETATAAEAEAEARWTLRDMSESNCNVCHMFSYSYNARQYGRIVAVSST